jgi:hypothetical protein
VRAVRDEEGGGGAREGEKREREREGETAPGGEQV